MGSFEGCLGVQARRNASDALQWEDFSGKWCLNEMRYSGPIPGPRVSRRVSSRPDYSLDPMTRMPLFPDWIGAINGMDDISLVFGKQNNSTTFFTNPLLACAYFLIVRPFL